jgi:hypothetical protein
MFFNVHMHSFESSKPNTPKQSTESTTTKSPPKRVQTDHRTDEGIKHSTADTL